MLKSSTSLFAKPVYKVTIQHEGKETILDVASDYSILNAALDAGIELPYDCKLGVCLTCPSRVVSGKVDQTEGTLDDSVTEQGYALTCITYPRSDCVIKSIEEDELVSAQFKR
jgi:ferredoxin